MAQPVRIVAFAGSTREGSFNRKLIRLAADAARTAGAEVNLVELRDYPMPFYDGDLEKEGGLPDQARRLREVVAPADALLIASPEYNSCLSAVLKNAIDWLSRPAGDAPALAAFTGKVAGIMSATPSPFGGLRSMLALRLSLNHVGVLVLPDQVSIPSAQNAFDDGGRLKDAASQSRLEALGKKLVRVATALRS